MGNGNKGFPTFAVIILVLGILWILSDIGMISVTVSWFPVVLVIIALGWLTDHYRKK